MQNEKATKWKRKSGEQSWKKIDLLKVAQFTKSYNAGLYQRNLELNNTVNLIATQNQILDQDNRLLRAKSYHEKNRLIDVCQNQVSLLATTNFTLNKLRQSYGQLQWKAAFINDNLKHEIMSMDLKDHEKSVELERLLAQMRERLVQKDYIINQLHNSILEIKKQNQWLRQENNNYKIAQFGMKIDDQYGRRKQQLVQILRNNEKCEQYIKIKNEELSKENQGLKKQVNSDRDRIFDLQEELSKNRVLIDQLKRMLTDRDTRNKDLRKIVQPVNILNIKSIEDDDKRVTNAKLDVEVKEEIEIVNIQQFLSSIPSLRNGINKQMMEIFTKCLKEGEKEKKNPLSVFLLEWKQFEINRITSFAKS